MKKKYTLIGPFSKSTDGRMPLKSLVRPAINYYCEIGFDYKWSMTKDSVGPYAKYQKKQNNLMLRIADPFTLCWCLRGFIDAHTQLLGAPANDLCLRNSERHISNSKPEAASGTRLPNQKAKHTWTCEPIKKEQKDIMNNGGLPSNSCSGMTFGAREVKMLRGPWQWPMKEWPGWPYYHCLAAHMFLKEYQAL